MSTNLSDLINLRRGAKKREFDAINGSVASSNQTIVSSQPPAKKQRRRTANRKTKDERDAEFMQLCLLEENKYKCDHTAVTFVRFDSNNSQNIVFEPQPSAQSMQTLGSNVPALLRKSVGAQGDVTESGTAQDQAAHKAWHDARASRLVTSSRVARQLGMAEPFVSAERRMEQFFHCILELAQLVPRFAGNKLTEHGKRMEPFARQVYMQERAKQPVIEVGFIAHAQNDLVGASPDGVTWDGKRLCEFKCPMKRTFQTGDKTPLSYWHQVQLQLEVCNLNVADYFEVRRMRRPRGQLRQNCVCIVRDTKWFHSVQPLLRNLAKHQARACKLRSLFPDEMFDAKAKPSVASTNHHTQNIEMYTKVILE